MTRDPRCCDSGKRPFCRRLSGRRRGVQYPAQPVWGAVGQFGRPGCPQVFVHGGHRAFLSSPWVGDVAHLPWGTTPPLADSVLWRSDAVLFEKAPVGTDMMHTRKDGLPCYRPCERSPQGPATRPPPSVPTTGVTRTHAHSAAGAREEQSPCQPHSTLSDPGLQLPAGLWVSWKGPTLPRVGTQLGIRPLLKGQTTAQV